MSVVWLATLPEAAAVARLLTEFRDHLEDPEPSEDSFLASVERLIGRDDTEFWLAAPSDGEPAAGLCQLRFRHSVWTATEDCWLEDLFVRREARGRGVGRALVQRALERARERGCRRVELDTYEDNNGAIRLYESFGFSARSKGPSRSLYLGVAIDR